MTSAKEKIQNCVQDYLLHFPQEFEMFKDMMWSVKGTLEDEEFGTAKGSGNDMRALIEMPETLHNLIVSRLSTDELTWFKSGTPSNKNAGARWFARSFPAFALSTV